jgi:LPS export ABC transporter protein LptC
MSKRIVLILLLLIFFLTNCKKEKISVNIEELKEKDYIVYGMTLRHFKGKNLEWELRAKQVDTLKEPSVSNAKDVDILYFSDNNTTALSAEYGDLDYLSGNMMVEKDVIVENSQQKILTDKLLWNNKLKKFLTDAEVTIIQKDKNTIIEGKGLIANSDLTDIKIEKMYKTTIKDIDKIKQDYR